MKRGSSRVQRPSWNDPVNIAGYVAIGLTCLVCFHATVRPQFKDLDFALYLSFMAAFVVYSVGYIVRVRWFRATDAAGGLRAPPEGGSALPPEDSPVPVPTGPRTPLMRCREAKALPVEPPARPRSFPAPILLTLDGKPDATPDEDSVDRSPRPPG